MKRSARVVAFVVVVLCASAIASLRWNTALPASHKLASLPSAESSPAQSTLDSVLDDAADALVANDPFRLANRPASVRYDPVLDGGIAAQPAPVVAAARPVMTLKAIVGGPPWQAVVDGIPGQPAGTLVRAGNAFDKLVIRDVSRDSVVIQGPDTSWVLSFRSRR